MSRNLEEAEDREVHKDHANDDLKDEDKAALLPVQEETLTVLWMMTS